MRKCVRCQTEMIENFDIKVQGAGYGVTIADSEKVFADRIGKPKVAICPQCGEISFYIENPEKLNK
ncbi:nucleic acid-binding protein [Anaerorhabdus sp.]|uniref:nucleic acid-binding protein n=1 Tax=Anaerorhabdus sp. TaxID=1872524 RepID=UPI002FC712AB